MTPNRSIFGTLAELREIAAAEYVHELGSYWGAKANLSFGDALQEVIEDCEKRLKTIKAEAAAFYSRQRKI